MKYTFFLLIVLFPAGSRGQHINYDSLRITDSYNSCIILMDSGSLESHYKRLLLIDTSSDFKGRSDYFKDIGFNRYKMYALTNDSNFLHEAILHTKRSYALDSNNSDCLWNLGLFYFFKNDCNQALYYLHEYDRVKKMTKYEKSEFRRIKKSSRCKTR